MIPAAVNATKVGEWLRSFEIILNGKIICLLGFGSVGEQVVGSLGGFECTILAYDPVPDIAFVESHGVIFVYR